MHFLQSHRTNHYYGVCGAWLGHFHDCLDLFSSLFSANSMLLGTR
eukprot:COSAG02_NODE_127_length_34879_cov_12.705060_8_plen_45_part_00